MKMSTLRAEALVREFHYNGIRIPDPGPDLTVEQVRDLLAPNYPQSSLILARHLQCKRSLDLARILAEAMDRHAARDSQQLAAPTDLLPPLA
jgi:Prokaryotic Ubiquitin